MTTGATMKTTTGESFSVPKNERDIEKQGLTQELRQTAASVDLDKAIFMSALNGARPGTRAEGTEAHRRTPERGAGENGIVMGPCDVARQMQTRCSALTGPQV